ncbi:MAG: hypothetical protein AAF548_04595 [Actinomycetota bacterium]
MLTSIIVSVSVVLVAAMTTAGRRPPWALQPAMRHVATGAARPRRPADMMFAAPTDNDDDTSIVMDSLRAIGLVRKRVDQPIVGKKAYVRLWERVRAIVVLAAIIVSLGVLLAAVIGIIFLAAGFLLEQAIG